MVRTTALFYDRLSLDTILIHTALNRLYARIGRKLEALAYTWHATSSRVNPCSQHSLSTTAILHLILTLRAPIFGTKLAVFDTTSTQKDTARGLSRMPLTVSSRPRRPQ